MLMQYVLKPLYVSMGENAGRALLLRGEALHRRVDRFHHFCRIGSPGLLLWLERRWQFLSVLGILLVGSAVAYIALLDMPPLGGTLGKRLMRVRTVGKGGTPIGNGHAILRGILKSRYWRSSPSHSSLEASSWVGRCAAASCMTFLQELTCLTRLGNPVPPPCAPFRFAQT